MTLHPRRLAPPPPPTAERSGRRDNASHRTLTTGDTYLYDPSRPISILSPPLPPEKAVSQVEDDETVHNPFTPPIGVDDALDSSGGESTSSVLITSAVSITSSVSITSDGSTDRSYSGPPVPTPARPKATITIDHTMNTNPAQTVVWIDGSGRCYITGMLVDDQHAIAVARDIMEHGRSLDKKAATDAVQRVKKEKHRSIRKNVISIFTSGTKVVKGMVMKIECIKTERGKVIISAEMAKRLRNSNQFEAYVIKNGGQVLPYETIKDGVVVATKVARAAVPG